MNGYAPIDMIFAILALIMIIRGFLRGFVVEVFSLGAVVLGLIASFLLYRNGAAFIRERYFDMKALPEILSFIVIFAIVFLLGKLIQKLVSDIIDGLNLNTIDKMLGGIFGLLEGIIAISLVLFIFYIQPIFNPQALLRESVFAKIILPIIIGVSSEFQPGGKVITPETAALFLRGFLG